MKVIGLLGGMSWESSAEYYRIINDRVKQRMGGLHSAKIVLYSLDFAEVEAFQSRGDWDSAATLMVAAAKKLEAVGAECLVICTNTMHKLAVVIQNAIRIPLIHIADATAQKIKSAGISEVGLLGTRFTMEQDFYRGRLETQHALKVVVPDDRDRAIIHRIIYDELCKGIIREESRAQYQAIVQRLEQRGCQAVILGCTEIGMLINSNHSKVPLFDTAQIHAEAAVDFAL